MRCPILLALAVLWHIAANAAEVLPVHLIGTWGTAESLYVGTTEQSELHLEADGFGIMAGSSKPAGHVDGSEEEKRAPRAVIGFPVRAILDGDTVTVRPFGPRKGQVEQAEQLAISCRYAEIGQTLTCTGPDNIPIVMKRRSETIPAEVAKMIKTIRSQTSVSASD